MANFICASTFFPPPMSCCKKSNNYFRSLSAFFVRFSTVVFFCNSSKSTKRFHWCISKNL